jgi:integrase
VESNYGHAVNLKQYRRLEGKWQFVPVLKQNGKPNPKLVLVNGEPVSSKGGTFYLDWREDGKRRTRRVGTTPREALDAWQLQSGIRTGEIEAPDEPERDGLTIDQGIENYLVDVKATKGLRTYRSYRSELQWFREHCGKKFIAQLDRSDAMRLFADGRTARHDGQPLSQKTINKRVVVMLNGMRSQGATIELKKGDWPKTIDKKVEIYEPEELTPFLAACTPVQKLIFQVFLCTGFREREVANLAWTDIDWKLGNLSVSAKPERGFTPKSYEERSVPVPHTLIKALLARKRASTSQLVFPTEPHHSKPECKGDKPDNHMLELCKEIAFRAGLNCGHCEGNYTVYVMREGVTGREKRPYKCATSPRCSDWYLHKFRHTFATNMLQSDVDIRSLQIMLGHKNIATTEKYLKSLRLDQLRAKIEASSLAAYV